MRGKMVTERKVHSLGQKTLSKEHSFNYNRYRWVLKQQGLGGTEVLHLQSRRPD